MGSLVKSGVTIFGLFQGEQTLASQPRAMLIAAVAAHAVVYALAFKGLAASDAGAGGKAGGARQPIFGSQGGARGPILDRNNRARGIHHHISMVSAHNL
jgi:hypothetical protein